MTTPGTDYSSTVAIYGGSFSPPHVGHAMVAAWLLWTRRVDQVWLTPVYRHAFEGQQDKQLASFEQRCSWCLAFADALGEGVEVCRIESELPTPSYTIDTLRSLRRRHPEFRFRLVVGSDVLPQLPQWRDWSSIAEEFSPIVVARDGYPSEQALESPVFPGVSSSEIRERLAKGQPVEHLVPAEVVRLIRSQDPQ